MNVFLIFAVLIPSATCTGITNGAAGECTNCCKDQTAEQVKEKLASQEAMIQTLTNKLDGMMSETFKMQQAMRSMGKLLADAEKKCPDRFIPFSNSCYYFGNIALSWHAAKTACYELGAALVAVETPEEDKFILETIKSLPSSDSNQHGYYTGGNELETYGKWVWDSTGLPFGSYQPWISGQGPQQAPNSHQKCHGYWRPDGFAGWHDHPCDSPNTAYICEIFQR